jgi:glyceraldehyde 3-phosphate dehydrogenase
MTNVAINGLGRIGRAVFKLLQENESMKLVAINDLVPPENLAYLLNYDTVYGRYHHRVEAENGELVVNGSRFPVLSEKDPASLPWKEREVDLVFECTGIFTKGEDLKKHMQAGARQVILSAPAKSGEVTTVVHGVNQANGDQIISCASCTTNCIAPVFEVMGRRIGVKKAMMTTVHAYTSTQSIVDGPSKKPRRGRAAAQNLVPASTGAAKATTKALPQYEGKFDGVAVRVPVVDGSIADITFVTERGTSVEEINDMFREEAESDRYLNILGVSDDPLVSTDIIQDPRASIVDLGMTMVVDGDLVKVMAWYDNEWGYSAQMIREAESAVRKAPAG